MVDVGCQSGFEKQLASLQPCSLQAMNTWFVRQGFIPFGSGELVKRAAAGCATSEENVRCARPAQHSNAYMPCIEPATCENVQR